MAVLYNRACYFLADKIRDLKRSNLSAVMYIIRLLVLFVMTVWTFFLMNFALLKAAPSEYVLQGRVNGFEMFYYAFNSMFTNAVPQVSPSGAIAKVLAMGATGFLALLFAVVVVFVVTSLQKSRDDSQMDATIKIIREHADAMEPYIDERFGMDITEAIEALQKLRAGMIEWIYYVAPAYRPRDD
jgi:hypothetical protein